MVTTDDRKVVIRNIRRIATGDIEQPRGEGDTIVIEDGYFSAIGDGADLDTSGADVEIDANFMDVVPGFIDPHTHYPLGDWGPQQRQIGLMEEALLQGITTILSEGEQGAGYPRWYSDPEGSTATAMVGHKIFEEYRPGGLQKVHGGSLVLVEGLTEEHFKRAGDYGCWLVAQIGGAGLSAIDKVVPMLEWAYEHGFTFHSCNYGDGVLPDATDMTMEHIHAMEPKKIAHFNGGTTAPSWDQLKRCIEETPRETKLELIPYGNLKTTVQIVEYLAERDQLDRLMMGSDTPTGQGYQAVSTQRCIIQTSSLTGIAGDKAVAMGTGITADLYGLNTGKIEPGREADLVIIDTPPGSVGEDGMEAIEAGDVFGIGLVMVDGRPAGLRGRDSRPVRQPVKINGIEAGVGNINEYLFDPPRMYYEALEDHLPW